MFTVDSIGLAESWGAEASLTQPARSRKQLRGNYTPWDHESEWGSDMSFPFDGSSFEKKIILSDAYGNHNQCGFCFWSEPLDSGLKLFERLFTAKEISHLDGIKIDKRRLEFVRGRLAVKRATKALNGSLEASVEVEYGCLRQPLLQIDGAGSPLQVSLSHNESCASAIVFSPYLIVGIDIEAVKPRIPERFVGFVSEREMEIYTELGLEEDQALTTVWTVKEALVKALRVGMGSDFAVAEVKSAKQIGQKIESSFSSHHQLYACSWIDAGLVLSIVLPNSVNEILW